ncbi:MAG: prepilin-type N-terminal cleavage/methylation domain-containing protein [Desulfobacterales bacterium]|nr:prepilin-type N-terminal cleavage/methylation domain-containing protein [Desulfobacterales bacterium]
MKKTGNGRLRIQDNRGFTMIEIIVTIVIAAILGTIAIQFSGTSLSMSARTVARIKNSYTLNEVMEKITRDYGLWLEANPNEPISAFETQIQADYSAHIKDAATGTDSSYFVDATGDTAIDLLHLTLTDGTQSIVALFAK